MEMEMVEVEVECMIKINIMFNLNCYLDAHKVGFGHLILGPGGDS